MRNRLLVLAAIAGIVLFGFYAGVFEIPAPERLREYLASTGVWGPLLVVVLFTLLVPFGVPGALFLLATTAVWPFWIALLVNWIGAIGAGMFGLLFARFLCRDWVTGRLPERLRRFDERLSNEGLPIVIGFRLMFFLNPASHWALGLSRVPLATAFMGTVVAFLPWVAVFTYFGAEILEWWSAYSTEMWFAIAAIVLSVIAIRRYRGRSISPSLG